MNSRFRIDISEIAYGDIREIFAYIAKESPAAAKRLLGTFGKMADSLEAFPHRCPVIPENGLQEKIHRHLIHGPYRMIFRVEDKTVFITRILHGARRLDPANLQD